MASTTISADSSGRLRPTLPRALARAIDIYEYENDPEARRVATTVDCTAGGGLGLRFEVGPAVGRGPHTQSTEVAASGQVQLRIPQFVGHAWGLPGYEIQWPDAEAIAYGPDGTATIRARVPDWEPAVDVGLDDLAGDQPTQRLVRSHAETTDTDAYQATIPYDVAVAAGVVDGDRRVAVSMACLDGQPVVVLRPTDTDGPSTLRVTLGGPQGRQARVSGAGLAAALGVVEQVGEAPVAMGWGGGETQVVGFVEESG